MEDSADSRIRAGQPEIPPLCMDSTYSIMLPNLQNLNVF